MNQIKQPQRQPIFQHRYSSFVFLSFLYKEESWKQPLLMFQLSFKLPDQMILHSNMQQLEYSKTQQTELPRRYICSE